MKALELSITTIYFIEIDEDAPIVNEYSTIGELMSDLAHYRCSNVLPVMGHGVKLIDSEIEDISWKSKE